jgi:hypothetical protein
LSEVLIRRCGTGSVAKCISVLRLDTAWFCTGLLKTTFLTGCNCPPSNPRPKAKIGQFSRLNASGGFPPKVFVSHRGTFLLYELNQFFLYAKRQRRFCFCVLQLTYIGDFDPEYLEVHFFQLVTEEENMRTFSARNF